MPKMGRTPCCSKVGLNRGAWSSDEDKLLIDYIQTHGEGQWRSLPSKAGLLRCGKSCRLRWMNYLRPGIKRGKFTLEEEDIIIRLHALHGNRWSLMATELSGRTDNEIKNHWNAHLWKRVKNASEHHSNTSKNKNVKKIKTLDVPKVKTTSDEKPKEAIILDSASSSSMSSLSTSKNESFENGMVSGASSSCTFDLSWLSSEPHFEFEGTSIIDVKQDYGFIMDGWEDMLKEDESLMLEKLYHEYQNILKDVNDDTY